MKFPPGPERERVAVSSIRDIRRGVEGKMYEDLRGIHTGKGT